MVTIEARPQPLELDPQRAALIVVDMQNDFGSPGGMFDAAGITRILDSLTPEPGDHRVSSTTSLGWVTTSAAVCEALARRPDLV